LKSLAPGVWRLREFPAPSINVYLAEDVLIDAGRRWDRRRIFAEIEDRNISMLALTHVHPDHQGVAKDVCRARGIPLACHADDVDAMEGRRPAQEAAPNNPYTASSSEFGRDLRVRSAESSARATRLRGFRSSTPPVTHAAR
jgi:glyoxylase-like metal-dependent hydrolase (beta-lactamase superfamily II)